MSLKVLRIVLLVVSEVDVSVREAGTYVNNIGVLINEIAKNISDMDGVNDKSITSDVEESAKKKLRLVQG